MFNVIICFVLAFLIIYLAVKYCTKRVEYRVNLQILEVLNDIFNVDVGAIDNLNIKNTNQTLVLLQVVINALGDTIKYFKEEYKVQDCDLCKVCIDFAMKRCAELDVEIDEENEIFIKTVILTYIQTHNLG